MWGLCCELFFLWEVRAVKEGRVFACVRVHAWTSVIAAGLTGGEFRI